VQKGRNKLIRHTEGADISRASVNHGIRGGIGTIYNDAAHHHAKMGYSERFGGLQEVCRSPRDVVWERSDWLEPGLRENRTNWGGGRQISPENAENAKKSTCNVPEGPVTSRNRSVLFNTLPP
jgi:hypothetical protein